MRGRSVGGLVPKKPIGARHPWLTLAAAVVVLLLLAALGRGVDGEMKATTLAVPGTESNHGRELLREHFGESAPFAILLTGPAAELNRQGPRLVEALQADPKVTTVSPWDRGTGMGNLRPNSRTALMLADFHVSEDTAMAKTVPRLERLIDRTIRPPVMARSAGAPTVARAIQDESIAVTKRGEEILTPILLLVLLLIFRSPVAAVIPLIFGASTVVAARGLIFVVAGFVDISGFALSIATMIGLAVGVDYALLIVSRFREELERGAEPVEAASITRMTAGRTTLFAGSILLIAVLVAAFLVPGAILLSLCATVAPVIVVAVAGPWVVGPAILVLLGDNVNRWQIGRRKPARTRWLAVSRGALRHPAVAAATAGVALLLVALPATSLATGPVTIEELPDNNRVRLDVEAIEAAAGNGWISPSVVVAVSQRGPITGKRTLSMLNRWQTTMARQPGIEAVVGPGAVINRAAPLQRAGRRFLDGGSRGKGGQTASLGKAETALGRLRRGLGVASEGARALALGSARARAGAGLLVEGIALAAQGGSRGRSGLDRFNRGIHQLASGARSVFLGASLLDFTASELGDEIDHGVAPESKRLHRALARRAAGAPASDLAATVTLEKLEAAWEGINGMSVGASDPRYAQVATAIRDALTAAAGTDPVSGAPFQPGYQGLTDAFSGYDRTLRESSTEAANLNSRLASVQRSIALLRKLAGRLRNSVGALAGGSRRLAGGSSKIVSGASRLGSGLDRLGNGARRLAGGLGRLAGGNARLEHGLSFAYRRTHPLVTGARQAEARIVSARRRLRRSSPGIFDSGYFTLSALDGAPPRSRSLANQAIDLGGGGQATKMLVVDSDRGGGGLDLTALNDRLRSSAKGLAARTGMEVAVTGGIAENIDYERSTTARLLPLVITITALTFLIMLVILRALPLAALAIALNLLAVAAAFGVLELLTVLPEGFPFGGTHEIDPVSAAGIFGVVFGLSIDYSVFLLMRMREGWEREQDNESAISFGLERTASVITGAATIMASAFVVLATAPIQSVSQFGVSLTVAVMLDATVIRLILVPALMRLIGPRVWWIPAWLERHLPRINVHPEIS